MKSMRLEEITALIEKRQYDDAISECDRLLTKLPEKRIEILRLRAYAFDMSGDSEGSLEDHERIFQEDGVAIKDFYLAGFRALFAGHFEKARQWFLEVLILSKEQDEDWFLSATLFYSAYVNLQLGDHDQASLHLKKAILIEEDLALPLPELGVCTGEQLREMIGDD